MLSSFKISEPFLLKYYQSVDFSMRLCKVVLVGDRGSDLHIIDVTTDLREKLANLLFEMKCEIIHKFDSCDKEYFNRKKLEK